MLICNIPGSLQRLPYKDPPPMAADPTILQLACIGTLNSVIRRSSIHLLYSYLMASFTRRATLPASM